MLLTIFSCQNQVQDNHNQDEFIKAEVEKMYNVILSDTTKSETAESYLTKDLMNLIISADQVSQKYGDIYYDTDYFLQSQDFARPSIKSIDVLENYPDSAIVLVSVKLYNIPEIKDTTVSKIKLTLKYEDQKWLVDDSNNAEGNVSLRKFATDFVNSVDE